MSEPPGQGDQDNRDIATDQHGKQLEANSNHQERIANQAHACEKTLALALDITLY